MAKRFEERLEAVRRAAATPELAAHKMLLAKTLGGKQGYLISVAAAALATADASLIDVAREAFTRLLEDPIKRDPQCHGKVAIARVLFDNDISADALFLAGATHVQLEPVLGGRQDTAAELRGISVMAMVNGSHPRALVTAAALLADPERAARLAAIRAVAAAGSAEVAEPLLRLRLACGDDDPEVLTDCMTELLRLAPAENLPLIAALIDAKDIDVAQSAALAVGGSRVAGALPVLLACANRCVTSERRSAILLAVAMLRSDAGFQHLIELLIEAPLAEAFDALAALATFRHQDQLVARVRTAVDARGADELSAGFQTEFRDV